MWIDSWMLLLIIAVSALSGGYIAFKCAWLMLNNFDDTLATMITLHQEQKVPVSEDDTDEVMFYDGVCDRCGGCDNFDGDCNEDDRCGVSDDGSAE